MVDALSAAATTVAACSALAITATDSVAIGEAAKVRYSIV